MVVMVVVDMKKRIILLHGIGEHKRPRTDNEVNSQMARDTWARAGAQRAKSENDRQRRAEERRA